MWGEVKEIVKRRKPLRIERSVRMLTAIVERAARPVTERNPMESFASLAADHAGIARDAAEIRRQAACGADAADTARAAIVVLSDHLRDHLMAEDSVVYRRLLACRDEGVADTARAARRSFATLAHDWQWFVSHWTMEAINEDPVAFSTDTAALLDRLDARIAFEEGALYPLAVGLADLPLHGNERSSAPS